jgi:SAM-dependent methyltransferase
VTELNEVFFELHDGLPREGPGRNRYTRKAYRMLPEMDRPRILDVGCGPGAPTMELARLGGGEVIGIDTHRRYLDVLEKKAEAAGISDRVRAVNKSMFKMDFPDSSFDIVWAEGSIYIMEFERGLREWRRLIRPGGYLVVHEMCWLRPDPPKPIHDYWVNLYPGIMTVPENLEVIGRSDYDLIGHFTLPDDAWGVEYYGPLEERIKTLRKKYADNPEALETLDREQEEIEIYRKYHECYGSVFFVMRKKSSILRRAP